MAAQKRSSTKNYIDLVEDEGEARYAAGGQPASVHPMKDYLLSLVAAMRSARGEAR